MKDFLFKYEGKMTSFLNEIDYELVAMQLFYCTDSLIEEIRDKKITQPKLAMTYALAIKASVLEEEEIDWKKINKAIIKRWSLSGLERVRRLAWIGFGNYATQMYEDTFGCKLEMVKKAQKKEKSKR